MLTYKEIIMLYYLIARVSERDQRKALRAQQIKLEKYANDNHCKFEYHEFDESAHSVDVRKEFSKLVEDIKSQKEPCIVVFDKIDRFTRDSSQEEVKELNALVRQGKIEIHFPSDNLFIDKTSPATDLFRLGIGMALAKYYSDSIRDNVKRRFDEMLASKTWVGYAPIGYVNVNLGTNDKPIKDIHVDTERAKHIVTMFELRSTGMPYEAIAEQVNKDGLLSKSGRKLNKSHAEKILKNPFYHGLMTYMGNTYPHKYEPLITRELFNKVQLVRQDRHDQHTAYRSKNFAFKEIVRCKACDCTVSSYTARGNVYMKCTGAKGDCGNVNSSEQGKDMMPTIAEIVCGLPIPAEGLEQVINELRKRHDTQQLYYTETLEQARKQYDMLKAKIRTLTHTHLEGRITKERYDEMVTDLSNEQQLLNDKQVKLTSGNKDFLITASYLLDLIQRSNELFECSTEVQKQKLIKMLLSNIKMWDKKLYFDVRDPYKTIIEENKRALSGSNNANWCG
ncbi:MAG: recombinase family protein [Patescibacteria group bacterium]